MDDRAATAAKGALGPLLLTLFLDLVSFSIMFPLYGEMMQWYGAADETVLPAWSRAMQSLFGVDDPTRMAAFFGATLGGLYALIQFFVTPHWGRLSDRVGRRPILIVTVCAHLASCVIWVFSASFLWLLVSRVIAAVASANISVASAAIADLSTPERRTKLMGLMGAVIGMGFLTGPTIGALASFLPPLGADDASGFALHPFSGAALIATGLNALNFVWVWTKLRETRNPEVTAVRGAMQPFAMWQKDLGRALPKLNFAYLLFIIAFAGFESTMVFLALQLFQFGAKELGPYMVLVGMASALVQGGAIRRLVPRFGERRLAVAGFVLLLPAFFLMAILPEARSLASFYVAGLLIGIGVGFVSPTLSSMVSLIAPPGAQGLAMGRFRAAGSLGRALGPLLAGILYFRFGPAMPYAVGFCSLLIPLALVASLKTGSPSQASPAEAA